MISQTDTGAVKSDASGRESFAKYRPVIEAVYYVVRLFPSTIRQLVWSVADNFDGRISQVLRYAIVRAQAKACGENIYIGKRVSIRNFASIRLGSNISLHTDCYLDGFGGIEIGDNVSVAHQTSILSFEHAWSDSTVPIKYNPSLPRPVKIDNDVWIGCGVRILGGSSIRNRVVVAAGAVVRGELTANCIYGGIPARPIRSI